ncbi:MAG: DNA topoisomerase 3 [Muribaculaceae bacterium]|nr:DNA topoisomerase 3 [Muribaculaceae bacterium]
MKVCVTEKPSVARDIARLLGANDRHEGYFEGNGYQVTWTFGHLCTLKEPNDYTDLWKRWSLASLPMIPQRFGIKLIEDDGIKKQFKVIETLISNADEVINCGDAGQEGELIQRWVYQKARCNKPVKRLWISSLTDESIRDGFQQLQDASHFDNLYFAGLSRAIGDWILGMNATRLYTLKYRNSYSRNVLSIGRVQTPTLALIVARQREIENFVPEDYWEIKTKYRDTIFNSTKGKFKTEASASEIVESIKDFPLTVTSVAKKKGKEAPPRLFDLTSLQVECNKKFSYSADETLRLIQSLYEKKVTTYPRVDTTYLSDDIYPKIPGIMQAMKPYAALTQPVLAGKLPKSKKVFDNSKVTDHHAIIPTNVDPASVFLTREEKFVYDLVAKRFIAAFYPDCEFSTTTVMAKVNEFDFKATGKEILKEGWRVIYNKDKAQVADAEAKDKDEDDNGIMPTFVEGESGPHEPSLLKKTTQPPKYYTEGTLLRAMETAGKFVDDDELRDAMKENGIGRPSTRAAIIETLHKRHYIAKQRKSLLATAAGIQLIDTIKEELLKSAKLTGLWENKLRKIERGEFSAQQFIDELKTLVNEIVLNVLRDNSSTIIAVPSDEEKKNAQKADGDKKPRKPRLKSIEEIACPVCGKGHIIKGRTAYGCSEFRSGCEMRLPFDTYPSDLTPAKLNTMIKKAYKK